MASTVTQSELMDDLLTGLDLPLSDRCAWLNVRLPSYPVGTTPSTSSATGKSTSVAPVRVHATLDGEQGGWVLVA